MGQLESVQDRCCVVVWEMEWGGKGGLLFTDKFTVG